MELEDRLLKSKFSDVNVYDDHLKSVHVDGSPEELQMRSHERESPEERRVEQEKEQEEEKY